MHEIKLSHEGLQKHRVVRGRDARLVKQKARLQQALWEAQWQEKLALLARQERRANQLDGGDAKKALAKAISDDAQARLAALDATLAQALARDAAIDWQILEDHGTFDAPPPKEPAKPSHLAAPEPMLADFPPPFSLANHLFAWTRGKVETQAFEDYQKAFGAWERAREEYDSELKVHEARRAAWELERDLFRAEQELSHYAIEAQARRYRVRAPEAIADYCDLQLTHSAYPDFCPKVFEIVYQRDCETLVVDYLLPAPEDLPGLKEVKYVQSRDAFDEKQLSKTALNKLYGSLVLQIALRTLYELIQADVSGALAAVVFNGWVHSLDKASGREMQACILSLEAGREAFLAIDLAEVAPKDAFKALKGVGSARLHSLTPVAPILRGARDEPRFLPKPEAAGQPADGGDLANLDWRAFEQLIRGIFEREFARSGGALRVTRASREAGIEAIAVDPDPLRGGKIVIHARRASDLVGAGALRDLYGAVVDEGASKGILVTTSCYGPDAYAFAKGKPLTLLDGSNLLQLMGKQGQEADIEEEDEEDEPIAAAG